MSRSLLLLLTAAVAVAQQPAFKTGSRLVIVPASVTDKHIHSIDGLCDRDFTLLDNGRRRSVHVDPAGSYLSRLSLAIVVQASGISKAALLKIRKTGSLIDGYVTGEGGEAAVLSATDKVGVLQDFTTDGIQIRDAFRNITPGAERDGHVLDGVAEAIHMLEARAVNRRRLVLVISETRDRGSTATPQEVLTSAQKNNVTIYTISYSAYITPFTTRASDLGPPFRGNGSACRLHRNWPAVKGKHWQFAQRIYRRPTSFFCDAEFSRKCFRRHRERNSQPECLLLWWTDTFREGVGRCSFQYYIHLA